MTLRGRRKAAIVVKPDGTVLSFKEPDHRATPVVVAGADTGHFSQSFKTRVALPVHRVGMRTMLLTCLLFTVVAGPAAAQSLQVRTPRPPGPDPKPTIGLAGGVFGTVDQDEHNDSNLLLSGTIEIPFNTNGRVRIEGARAALGSARITQVSMGLAAVREPGAPVSGYLGIGIGLYRASFDRAPTLWSRAGVHFYGGAELTLSRAITFDAELGVHALAGSSLHLTDHLLGESVFRLKFAL